MPKGLNEIGDSLAGFASALALVWLVGGYVLQQHELRETRQEYRQMRNNSEMQFKLLRRDNCAKAARMYLASLDISLDHFFFVFSGFFQRFLDKPPEFGRTVAIGVLIDLLEQNGATYRERDESDFDLLCLSLNKEIRRYATTFHNMLAYLSDQGSDGEWVRSVLIDNSIYADIMDRIGEASEMDGYTQVAFSLNSELSKHVEKHPIA